MAINLQYTTYENGQLIEKMIQIEQRLMAKVAKMEIEHQDTVLYYSEQIKKQATANKALSKIIRKLSAKINTLAAIVQSNNDIPKDCQIGKEESVSQSPLNSPIVLPTSGDEWEDANNDLEMNSVSRKKTFNHASNFAQPEHAFRNEEKPREKPELD